MKPDLVIRGGTLVDGSGAPPREADVAVAGDRIVAVGPVQDAGREEIDARGKIVTLGFVDVHTHLDAQLTWDPLGAPACWHGITSVVVGNCGVGFAPCRAADREYLMFLMEGVEDIPRSALAAGMRWRWERFGEYLDALASTPLGPKSTRGRFQGGCCEAWPRAAACNCRLCYPGACPTSTSSASRPTPSTSSMPSRVR